MQIPDSVVTPVNSKMVAFFCIWFGAVGKSAALLSRCDCEGGGTAYLRGIYELRCLVQTAVILPFQDMDYGETLSPPTNGAKIRACSLTERVLFTDQRLPTPRKLDM